MSRILKSFGVLAALSYISAVIIGGFSLHGYSHLYNSISELTAHTELRGVQALIALYNAALALFGVGLLLDFPEPAKSRVRTAASMLVVIGLLGLAMYFFPQDPRDAVMTFRGKMHIVLAGAAALLTMLAMILVGLDKGPRLRALSAYSFVSCAVTFLAGGLGAATLAHSARYGGLLERLTIGSFIQWLLVVSFFLIRSAKQK